MKFNKALQIGKYLKNVTEIYSPDISKSISDVFNSFSCLPKDFSVSIDDEFKYSSYNFNDCTIDEQNEFINDQLQFIKCLVTNSIYDKAGITWD